MPDGPMDAVGHTLTKKVGPLPLAGWFVAVGGGLALAVVLRRTMTGPDAEPVTEDEAARWESGADTGTPAGSGNLFTPDPGTMPPLAPVQPKTNPEWSRRARSELVARGYAPLVADNAIRKFLAGQPLNRNEKAVVDVAIALVGPPPYSPVPKPTDDKSPDDDTPKPPKNKPTPKGKTPRAAKNNKVWRRRVVELLTRDGMNRRQAHLALDKWLRGNGEDLTKHQREIVHVAAVKYAPPPHPPGPDRKQEHKRDTDRDHKRREDHHHDRHDRGKDAPGRNHWGDDPKDPVHKRSRHPRPHHEPAHG